MRNDGAILRLALGDAQAVDEKCSGARYERGASGACGHTRQNWMRADPIEDGRDE